MSALCAQLSNWLVLDEAGEQKLLQAVADELTRAGGYDPVPVQRDDPANPKCESNQSACYVAADRTIYYGNLDNLDSQRAVETVAHEVLHAIDDQDGVDDAALGDERAEKYTIRLFDEYGSDGEKMYAPGDPIPGSEHSEQVYQPGREIAEAITDYCKRRAKAPPESIESLTVALARQIAKILDQRWEPDDGGDDDDDEDGDDEDGDEDGVDGEATDEGGGGR